VQALLLQGLAAAVELAQRREQRRGGCGREVVLHGPNGCRGTA